MERFCGFLGDDLPAANLLVLIIWFVVSHGTGSGALLDRTEVNSCVRGGYEDDNKEMTMMVMMAMVMMVMVQ